MNSSAVKIILTLLNPTSEKGHDGNLLNTHGGLVASQTDVEAFEVTSLGQAVDRGW
jgi:hypothetical protein